MLKKRCIYAIAVLATLFCVAFCLVGCNFNEIICDHDFEPYTGLGGSVITEPTCVSGGEYRYKCRICGKEKTEQVGPDAEKHAWDDGVVLQEPTCTEDGLRSLTCTLCGASRSIPIGAQHTRVPISEAVKPTCTESGLTEGIMCSVCGIVIVPQYEIAPLGHEYSNDKCMRCGEERVYTVKFSAYGEIIEQRQVKASGLKNLEYPEFSKKTGYENYRWADPHIVNGEALVELAYDYVDYKITYNNVDGGANANPATFNLGDEGVTFVPARKPGYRFTGWYVHDAVGNATMTEGIEAGFCGDVEVYAEWELVTFTISYENCKTADISDFPTEYTIESDTITFEDISSPGYTFNGWSVGGRKTTGIIKGSYGNITVRAEFTADKYTVSLDANGGSVSNVEKQVDYGSKFALSVPRLNGYEFLGWYDGTEGDAKRYTDANGYSYEIYNILDDLKLYAHWEKVRISVTFDSAGGSAVERQKYDYGEAFVLPAAPQKPGYVFDGWYTQDGQKEYTPSTLITGSVTVYARWLQSTAISDKDGLLAVANAPDKNYHLTADIDLRGNVWTPISNYSGTFNGKGFAIKNFAVSTTAPGENYGFIRVNDGTVKNVTFADFSFSVSSNGNMTVNVGVVAGVNKGLISGVTLRGGKIVFNFDDYRNSRSKLEFFARLGGIAGKSDAGAAISECNNSLPIEANIKLGNYNASTLYMGDERWLYGGVGGIAGANGGSIFGCVYTGDIAAAAHARNVTSGGGGYLELAKISARIGGIVGSADGESSITQCYAAGEFTLTSLTDKLGHNYAYMGGLAGINSGSIDNSFSGGSVAGNASDGVNIGGLIGQNMSGGDVKSSYSLADVSTESGGNIGGLCGTNEAVIQNCFATGDSAGRIDTEANKNASVNAGGLVGRNTNTGSVSKSFSSGGVSSARGSADRFIGINGGIAFNCYYMQGSSVLGNGEYLDPEPTANIKAMPFNKLWSEEFLIGTMYWDSEGWVILTDERPMLEWEIAVGHDFVAEVSEPDCVHGGFTVYGCTDCGKVFVRNFVPPVGHSYEVLRTVAPTCDAEGYTVKKCSVCGDEIDTDFTDPTGHPEDKVSVKSERAATCTEQGLTVYHCDECGNDYSVTAEPTGHDGTLVRTEKQPTCAELGEAVYHCDKCDTDYTVTLECVAHTWIDVEFKQATCGVVRGEDGQITERHPEPGHQAGRKCSVCSAVDYGCEEIAPHSFELVSVTTEATCTHPGSGKYRCKTCELESDMEIARLDHKDEDKNFICDDCEQLLFTDAVLASFTEINNAAELRAMSDNPSRNYWLKADIDLTGEEWTAIGTADRPFRGIFFGDNHTIKGLRFATKQGAQTVLGGLFGYNAGTVLCVVISDFEVDTENADVVFGGVAAYNNGTVKHCVLSGDNRIYTYVRLSVTDYAAHKVDSDGSIIGGLVGVNRATAAVESCSVVGSVTAYISNISEVVSEKLTSSVMSLIKSARAETVMHVTLGGVVGRNEGKVTGCSVTGNTVANVQVKAELSWMKGMASAITHMYAGALAGYNAGELSDCRVVAMRYVPMDVPVEENSDRQWKASLYEISVGYFNYSTVSGTAGVVGSSDKAAVAKNITTV